MRELMMVPKNIISPQVCAALVVHVFALVRAEGLCSCFVCRIADNALSQPEQCGSLGIYILHCRCALCPDCTSLSTVLLLVRKSINVRNLTLRVPCALQANKPVIGIVQDTLLGCRWEGLQLEGVYEPNGMLR